MSSADKKLLIPAVTLALITPVLTELLSGNEPVRSFFLPGVYGMLVLIYGLPVLLIRELYLQWKLTLPGLFLLGLAYGIFNEGVLAKTLLCSENVPIDAFDHSTWLGINLPWAVLIVPWHASHAIIFPIALVTLWFPSTARTSWLSARGFWFCALLVTAIGVLIHLTKNTPITSPLYLVLFEVVIAALIFLSRWTDRTDPFLRAETKSSLWPAVAGFSFYPVLVLGLTFCAGFKLPGIVICLVAIVLLASYYRLLTQKGWLGLTSFVSFALGDYLSGSLLTGLFQLKTSSAGVITEAILAIFFGLCIFMIIRSNRIQPT